MGVYCSQNREGGVGGWREGYSREWREGFLEDWVDLHVKAIPRKEFDKLKCRARVWYHVTTFNILKKIIS